MCLISFAWKAHPKYKLIMVANRDEFFNRPTSSLGFWEEHPDILAGKDIKGGGTWLGISKRNRLTAITNYRDLANLRDNAPSRGHLTAGYLLTPLSSSDYVKELEREGHKYNGFNLLISDFEDFYYYSNYDKGGRKLEAGIYGLSNGLLDSDWVKVHKSKDALQQSIETGNLAPEYLLNILKDTTKAEDHLLPDTGVPYEWEKWLSSMHIDTENGYGTRCTTVVLVDYNNNVQMAERTYNENMEIVEEKSF